MTPVRFPLGSRTLFPFLCFALFAACSSKKTPASPAGSWRLYEAAPIKKVSGESFGALVDASDLVGQGYLLSIFEDGQCSEAVGEVEFRTGNWKKGEEAHALELKYPGRPAELASYTISQNEQGKDILSLRLDLKNLRLKFVRDGAILGTAKDDPFHPQNNRWRIKPSQPEDSAQLQERMLNYIKHVALILKAADERNAEIVSFGKSKGPIRIYNGGIGIHSFDVVPDSWKRSYYSEEQALTAHRMYQQYLRESSYQGASTGNWIKDDLSILLSIYSGMSKKRSGALLTTSNPQ